MPNNVKSKVKSKASASQRRKPATKSKSAAKAAKTRPAKLLSGGNPQIAKADGDAPVQAYIAAMPGWKRGVGRRLDALVVRTVPGVRKAVKWNSPLYGVEGHGWFLGIHCFTKYVKVAFFRGASLRPVPPGGSESKETRYLDIANSEHMAGVILAVDNLAELDRATLELVRRLLFAPEMPVVALVYTLDPAAAYPAPAAEPTPTTW